MKGLHKTHISIKQNRICHTQHRRPGWFAGVIVWMEGSARRLGDLGRGWAGRKTGGTDAICCRWSESCEVPLGLRRDGELIGLALDGLVPGARGR